MGRIRAWWGPMSVPRRSILTSGSAPWPGLPAVMAVATRARVPGYSGATVTDSHRLPAHPQLRVYQWNIRTQLSFQKSRRVSSPLAMAIAWAMEWSMLLYQKLPHLPSRWRPDGASSFSSLFLYSRS